MDHWVLRKVHTSPSFNFCLCHGQVPTFCTWPIHLKILKKDPAYQHEIQHKNKYLRYVKLQGYANSRKDKGGGSRLASLSELRLVSFTFVISFDILETLFPTPTDESTQHNQGRGRGGTRGRGQRRPQENNQPRGGTRGRRGKFRGSQRF